MKMQDLDPICKPLLFSFYAAIREDEAIVPVVLKENSVPIIYPWGTI